MTAFSVRRSLLNFILLLAGAAVTWGVVRMAGAQKWWRDRQTVHAVDVALGRKLVCATWRGSDLWVVTREARGGEAVGEVYEVARAEGWGLVREVYRISERPAPTTGDDRDAGVDPSSRP